MRLTTQQIKAIEQAAQETLAPHSTVMLFGSRLDDNRRGGDIDLLVESPQPMPPAELVEVRNRFIAKLYRLMGEQRIDVLLVPAHAVDSRPVVEVARRSGHTLVKVDE